MIKRLVVAGGGVDGWLTAAIVAAAHQSKAGAGLSVTVLEPPDVARIDVAEGTWPTMRETLRKIGVSETDLFRKCDASFKQGCRFEGWLYGRKYDHYFHPFVLPQGYFDTNLVPAWAKLHPKTSFADLVSFQPHLCAKGRAPKLAATLEFAAIANYAYHLDTGKFFEFLRTFCEKHLGVRRVVDQMVGVEAKPNGDIAGLLTRGMGLVEGDLFVDCTGVQSKLLGEFFGIPLISQRDVLFNDSAITFHVPYADERAPIASHAISVAQTAGWIWDIGLPATRDVGHVYSSAYTTLEEAESQLRAYVERTGSVLKNALPQKHSFRPGHRREFWHRNCIAIGQSAGFIEPLESTALALVELSASMLSDDLPPTRETMEIVRRRFNNFLGYRWERIVDFLKLHYVLSRREDSDYWKDNRCTESIPESLRELLVLWRYQPPSRNDFPRLEEIFSSASYQYVLYGMGFKPEREGFTRCVDDMARAEDHFREAARLARRYAAGLPAHRDLIDFIRARGLPVQ